MQKGNAGDRKGERMGEEAEGGDRLGAIELAVNVTDM